MIKLYLDIDGVLLTRKLEVPENIETFLSFVTTHFDCYWLTTHCRTGENKALRYLAQFYNKDLLKILSTVKACDWTDKKTDGIDYSAPFVWLDDYPFEAEKIDLRNKNALDQLLVVNLNRNNELLEIIQKLKHTLDLLSH